MGKKKKIYSKRKEPYIEVEKIPENNVEILKEMFGVDNIWTDFIDKAMYRREKINVPYEDNLLYILNDIKDNHLKKHVMVNLMRLEDYNPFEDSFPIEIFKDNHKSHILKVINKLKKEKEIVENEDLKDTFIMFVGRHIYKAMIIKSQEMPITQYVYDKGFNIVVIVKKNGFIITSNPLMKNRPDFTPIYKELNELEEGVWYLHGSRGMFKTENDKQTKLNTTGLMKILLKY